MDAALGPGKDEGVEVAPRRTGGEARSSLRGKLSGGSHPPAWTTERLAGQALISIVYGSQPDPAVSQPCHSRVTDSRNQEDTGGHQSRRRPRQSSTGGQGRNRRDTEGHTVVSVRDREAPGSNPGPPTSVMSHDSSNRRILTTPTC